jgi:hypothetical protein
VAHTQEWLWYKNLNVYQPYIFLMWLLFIPRNESVVVGNIFAQMKTTLWKYILFISDISIVRYNIQWVSWQHFYSQGLPTKKLTGNTAHLPSLWSGHTYIHLQFFCFDDLQKNRCMRKELSHQIYVFDLNLLPRILIHWTF